MSTVKAYSTNVTHPLGKSYSNNSIRAMATANAIKALQKADETIEQDPVPATTHTDTYSFSVNIPVSLPICHSPSSPSWQQEESSSPKL